MIYKSLRHSLLLSSLAVVATIVISGCSSSTTTTPPPPTTSTNVTPKKGSTYTYSWYKDTAGAKVPNSDTTYTATVTTDAQPFLGQNNVYTVLDRGDTTYLTYASNNDAMVYIQSTGITGIFQPIGDTVFHRWITLGTTSHSSNILIYDNTNVTLPSVPFPLHVHVVSDYIGDELIPLSKTDTLTSNHVRITGTASATVIGTTYTYTNQRDIYFVGKIGYAGKAATLEDVPAVTAVGLMGSKTGTHKVLTSYTLK